MQIVKEAWQHSHDSITSKLNQTLKALQTPKKIKFVQHELHTLQTSHDNQNIPKGKRVR
jgi:hypothetical protein